MRQNVIKQRMLILLLLCVVMIEGQQHGIVTPDESHYLGIEPFIINIRIPNVETCQEITTSNCENLIDHMLKCQQIIFNDPGFSYQQYQENIDVHRQILNQYQTMCEDIQNNDLLNDLFDFKKN